MWEELYFVCCYQLLDLFVNFPKVHSPIQCFYTRDILCLLKSFFSIIIDYSYTRNFLQAITQTVIVTVSNQSFQITIVIRLSGIKSQIYRNISSVSRTASTQFDAKYYPSKFKRGFDLFITTINLCSTYTVNLNLVIRIN